MGYGEGCPSRRTACNPEFRFLGSPAREERRSVVRGSRAILALAALALVLGATTLWAQDPYAMPLDRSIGPGRTTVKYDTHIYTFVSEKSFSVRFEKIDMNRVRLTVKPATQFTPHEEVSLQWGNFLAVSLSIDSSGGDTFILNTETGYAEK
jgi:hypothetical protein